MESGFPIDILLFAMVAAYLVFRLRNVLGRRDGHEGDYHDPFKKSDKEEGFTESMAEDEHWQADDDTVVHLTDRTNETPAPPETADSSSIPGMGVIHELDSSFDAGHFRDGACAAFEMILNAYAAGDTATLKGLLSAEVYGNFSQAIRDREQAGEVLEDTLVGIKSADIVEAYAEGRTAFVTIKFVTEQINVTRDENGDVVDGDPNKVIVVTDFWTFSRDTRSSNPNWSLVATHSAD